MESGHLGNVRLRVGRDAAAAAIGRVLEERARFGHRLIDDEDTFVTWSGEVNEWIDRSVSVVGRIVRLDHLPPELGAPQRLNPPEDRPMHVRVSEVQRAIEACATWLEHLAAAIPTFKRPWREQVRPRLDPDQLWNDTISNVIGGLALGGIGLIAAAGLWFVSGQGAASPSIAPTADKLASPEPTSTSDPDASVTLSASLSSSGSASVIRGGGIESFNWYGLMDPLPIGDLEVRYSAPFAFRLYLTFSLPTSLWGPGTVFDAHLVANCRVEGDPASFGPLTIGEAQWEGDEPDWESGLPYGWQAALAGAVSQCSDSHRVEWAVSPGLVENLSRLGQPLRLQIGFDQQFELEDAVPAPNATTDQLQLTTMPHMVVSYSATR